MKQKLSPFPFDIVLDWYAKNGRTHLPWRKYDYDIKTLGYRVWLAETMLQQTQVERVKIYFENILQTFPSVEDLARTSYEDFFPYYKWLGYYSRARNMLKTAQKVVSEFWWVFPSETTKLRTLPWVWPYTAEAIRAFAYDIPTLSFDTNLEKIFSRYFFGTKFQKLTKEEKEVLLKQMKEFCNSQDTNSHLNPLSFQEKGTTKKNSRDINNALMDFWATVSLNSVSSIDWENYPLTDSKFYLTRGTLEPVPVKKKSSFPTRQAYVICILHENHKKYFSENSLLNPLPWKGKGATDFSPFFIGKNTGNPRDMIQKYFTDSYHLELSVRPPEVKSYNAQEIPYLVCYAQIQSWTHDFQVFKNIQVRGYEEGLVEKMDFWENLSLF